METKFLDDGRKVAIIGTLNQKEYIVQEIFVTEGGDETPSGERFVAKSLHDVPLKSYAEKQAIAMEERLTRAKDELAEVTKDLRKLQNKRKGFADILKANQQLIDKVKLGVDDFDLFCDAITGNVKWVCGVGDYDWWRFEEFNEKIFAWDSDLRYDGIKLMTVLGKSEGDITYRINRYGDGSGSYTEYKFYHTDDELKAYLQDKMDYYAAQGKLNVRQIDKLEEIITVPDVYKQECIDRAHKAAKDSLDNAIKRAQESYQQEMEDIDS